MDDVVSILKVTAEAEVVTALDTLLAIRALCKRAQSYADEDVATMPAWPLIHPDQILRILDGDLT